MTSEMPCPNDCKGIVKPTAKTGRTMHFRVIPDLPVPDDVVIPTCDVCGEELLDRKEAEAVHNALELVYVKVMAQKTAQAIQTLSSNGWRQRQIERLLGLSSGRLSKIKDGGKDASPELVAVLMLLAASPSRPSELAEMWRANPKEN